jgi:hypothetical protein
VYLFGCYQPEVASKECTKKTSVIGSQASHSNFSWHDHVDSGNPSDKRNPDSRNVPERLNAL